MSSNSATITLPSSLPSFSSTTTSAPPVTTNTSGLSSGAKAGIGVGVSLGVVGICSLLAALFLIRRHRKKTTLADSEGKEVANVSSPSQNLSPTIRETTWEDTIIGPDHRHEVGQGQQDEILEMPGESRALFSGK